MTAPQRRGPLIILSGPSGSGKSTVVARLLEITRLPLRRAITATTRQPRPGEVDGVDYHFWSLDYFESQIQANAMLEYARVHSNLYGTPRLEVEDYRNQGLGVLLIIDVQGAALVRVQYPDSVSIFLKAGAWEIYEQRIRKRGSEDDSAIARRLESAMRELERVGEYQHVIVSDDVDRAADQLEHLIAQNF